MKSIFIGLFISFMFFSAHSQKVFMYGENGTKVYFSETDSLVQIRFKKNVSANEKLQIVKALNPNIGFSLSSNRVVIPIQKKGISPMYDDVKRNNSVIYANQSLQNDDGDIQIPTEKVLVKIKSNRELGEILKNIGVDYESYKRLGHDKNSYMIVLKNGESLSVANVLYETGFFEYAQPSFTRFIEMMNEYSDDQWGFTNTGQYGGTCSPGSVESS